MQVLTNGYKLPETGDFGDVWFPAIEDNIQRLNDHTHDGTNSEKLESKNIQANFSTVLSGAFSASGTKFRATVAVPSGADFDNMVILCKDPTSKDQMYLEIEKIDDSSFYVYLNIVQDVEVYFIT